MVPTEASAPMTLSLTPETTSLVEANQVHRAIYRDRPDVGIVIIAHPRWASRLAQLEVEMPAIFDEQIRQLGPEVSRWNKGKDGPRPQSLIRGENAFVMDDAVICLGTTSDRGVFNLELLEKCAKSFVLAYLSGQRIGRIPRWVQWIAGSRLKRDERRAAEAFARGEYPVFAAGY